MMSPKTKPYDTADYLTDDESIREFLTASSEEGDIAFLSTSLEEAIRGYGIAHLAKITGISHGDVVRALHLEEDSDTEKLLKIMSALGVRTPAKNAA